ncbi:uncharacterized protein LOC131067024 isoform X1 [Cryptomeria japonica]|uniref:uncharacterized protein LOC131067024 isoform X1 n=2 Tax=Cryptomeria japonica TaxID=3369 RepID=UPI0027DA4646|nr:uncharacterized protein LOC131067024 isoform X1 [Cryptomeria japonica]
MAEHKSMGKGLRIEKEKSQVKQNDTFQEEAISVTGEEMTGVKAELGGWIRLKIVDPLVVILKRGVEPKQLALSAALGLTLGIFPICGVTVLLCGIAATLLGSAIQAPTLMLANLIATPIELSLVIPFLRVGEVITGGAHLPLTSDALKKLITGQASHEVLLGVMHALIGWLVTAPFILMVLYILFIPIFKFSVHKFSHHPASPKKTHQPHPEAKIKVRNV